jgi:hypothetical protein
VLRMAREGAGLVRRRTVGAAGPSSARCFNSRRSMPPGDARHSKRAAVGWRHRQPVKVPIAATAPKFPAVLGAMLAGGAEYRNAAPI